MHGLERLVVEDSAANAKDQLPQSGAQRNLHEAGTLDLADQGEGLGALARLGAALGEPIGAVLQDAGDARQRFDVVDDGRSSPQSGDGGERRADTGRTASPFDRRNQGGFLAAHKSARTFLDLDAEVEPRTEDVVAQQPVLFRLPQGDAQAFQGQRILGPAIDVAFAGPDGAAGDRHALQQRVGIGLQQGAVHKRAGVAFIGVGHDVFWPSSGVARKSPFFSSGKSSAAAAAQSGSGNLLNDVLWLHRAQRLGQAGVSAHRQIPLDSGGVDHAVVRQHHAALFSVEGDFFGGGAGMAGLLILVQQPLDDAAGQHCLPPYLGDVFLFDALVENVAGIDDHQRTAFTEAVAAGAFDAHHQRPRVGLPTCLAELREDLLCSVCYAARAQAHPDAVRRLLFLGNHARAKLFQFIGAAQLCPYCTHFLRLLWLGRRIRPIPLAGHGNSPGLLGLRNNAATFLGVVFASTCVLIMMHGDRPQAPIQATVSSVYSKSAVVSPSLISNCFSISCSIRDAPRT